MPDRGGQRGLPNSWLTHDLAHSSDLRSLVESAIRRLKFKGQTAVVMVEFPRLREVDPGDYGWSSHGVHAHGKADPLITDHEKYLALGKTPGERQHAYRELFRSHLDPDAIHSIRDALNQSQALGSERFKDEIEHQLQRRVRPGQPGRPKKRPEKRS